MQALNTEELLNFDTNKIATITPEELDTLQTNIMSQVNVMHKKCNNLYDTLSSNHNS